jgi:thiol-disulfide isomerase/thioredoxin
MNSKVIALGGIVLVIILGFVLMSNNSTPDTVANKVDIGKDLVEAGVDTTMDEDESIMDETTTEDGMESMVAGSYEAYSEEKLTQVEGTDVVLFFHASWCPSCRSADKNLETSKGDIPADLVILKLDYDANTELRKKYGLTTQHSFVQVDAEGNLVKKWIGSNSIEDIEAQRI